MDALISLVYTIIDSVCVCLFLDAFASHRWRDHRFLVGVIVQTILMYASIEFSVIALNRNQIVKIFLILLSCFIVARTLYENISGRFLLFLIVVEYLLTYSLSFAVGMLATSVCGMDAQTFQADKALSLICGMDAQTFQADKALSLIYGISYYSAELFIIALFRKMMLQRMGNRPRSDAQHSQLILYFLFPCASFVMLVILLYVTSGHNIEEFVSAGCCILIFISNVAVLFLLERMEYAASEREQLLMLNQQIQLQSKNMTSASELYSAQRKKVHDFRAHLNILNQLMKNQEYSAAEEYLEKITEQQTDRLFLVNTHHPILDALFNTKATEATQKKISIDFEVNDLSNLPFDASDIVVLLSNLLDNAIEACQQYDKGDKAIHVMAVAQQDFFVSVRNTSEPVVIINGSIPTTKPEPQMHGFGLANIRLILEKYSGEYTMFYENGWFQFTADIPLTPIS